MNTDRRAELTKALSIMCLVRSKSKFITALIVTKMIHAAETEYYDK